MPGEQYKNCFLEVTVSSNIYLKKHKVHIWKQVNQINQEKYVLSQ